MDFIRQMGAEFATAHPQVAGQLLLEASQCADPHVERLLEAFAFLTARIRKKIDDEYPEITDALLSVVYPHYQRPIPSMAVVEFVPSADATKMTVGHLVGRGVELTSPPISGGSPCRFRSAFPVTLWPVAVESASMAPDRVAISGQPAGSVALLRLASACTAGPGRMGFARRVRLAPLLPPRRRAGADLALREPVQRPLRGLGPGEGGRGGREDGGPPPRLDRAGRIRPRRGDLALSRPVFPSAILLLQEYFAFPPKFLFFNLRNLELVREAKFTGPVEVLFFLKQAPKAKVVIRPDNFRLGCSPVVNLFEMAAEPIRLDRLRTAYAIVPKYGELAGYEVYSVDKVVSVGTYLDGVVEFQPFYAMRHSAATARKNAYWFASRRPSLRDGDEGIEVELSFTDAEFSPTTPSVETVTTHLTCTNRDIPSRLPFGGSDVVFQLESDAPVGQVRLLTRPTKTYRPPLGRSAQWAAIAHLGPNHLSLVDSVRGPEALRELLKVYDFADSAVTRKLIEGITDVSSRRVAGRTGNRMGNTLSLGMEVTIQFDEESYAGSGAFLTASVLERFLGAYVTINSFTQMVATSKQREGPGSVGHPDAAIGPFSRRPTVRGALPLRLLSGGPPPREDRGGPGARGARRSPLSRGHPVRRPSRPDLPAEPDLLAGTRLALGRPGGRPREALRPAEDVHALHGAHRRLGRAAHGVHRGADRPEAEAAERGGPRFPRTCSITGWSRSSTGPGRSTTSPRSGSEGTRSIPASTRSRSISST